MMTRAQLVDRVLDAYTEAVQRADEEETNLGFHCPFDDCDGWLVAIRDQRPMRLEHTVPLCAEFARYIEEWEEP